MTPIIVPDTSLFTVDDARAFDKLQLGDDGDYPDDAITTKEAELREWFGQIFGVDFVPVVHTDESHDGYATPVIMLDWPMVSAITAASYRNVGDTTWHDLDADALSVCQISGRMLYWENGAWPNGRSTAKVTYTAGYAAVPARIKRAALQMAVMELVPTNLPIEATEYDLAGTTVAFGRADGWRDNWFRSPDGQAAFAAYSMRPFGIA